MRFAWNVQMVVEVHMGFSCIYKVMLYKYSSTLSNFIYRLTVYNTWQLYNYIVFHIKAILYIYMGIPYTCWLIVNIY